MTNKDAIARLKEIDIRDALQEDYDALHVAVKALELLDTLTERPCSVCRHHKERTEQEVGGCCKWDCVFDGHIGGKE